MKRTKRHEILKGKEKGGKEISVPKGRLDVATKIKALEIERSGQIGRIEHAIKKLKADKRPQKILRVPQKDMPKAKETARKLKAPITITNEEKTKRIRIKPK